MIKTNERLILMSQEKYEHKFSYSEVDPQGLSNQPSRIFCPKHGYFEQTMKDHLSVKHGCKECSLDSRRRGHSYYVKLVNEQVSEGYTVDTSFVQNRLSKLLVNCPIHGQYETTVGSFIIGGKCKKCGNARSAEKQRKHKTERISEFRKIHGDTYDYSLMPEHIKSNKVKIPIICPVHGMFEQRVNDHLSGKGCRSCSKNGCDNGYVHLIKDDDLPVCIKYGIAKNVQRRMVETSSSTHFQIVNMFVFSFNNSIDCYNAETEIKNSVGNHLNKNEMKDGWSETCDLRFLDFVIDTFVKFGGVRV